MIIKEKDIMLTLNFVVYKLFAKSVDKKQTEHIDDLVQNNCNNSFAQSP